MNTITQSELETRIADVAGTIATLAKANKKKPLRKALAKLASLKAQRSPAIIYQLDCEKGLGDSA